MTDATTATTKKIRKRDIKNAVNVTAKPNETDNEAIARNLLEYPIQAASTVAAYLKPPFDSVGVGDLLTALHKQAMPVHKGDMKGAEALLVSQAYTLDAIFHRLAQRAQVQENDRWFELFLKLGLRAQSQCRATLETLSTIKNPPVVFARQANVATNQQINVGPQAGPPAASQPTAIDVTLQPQIERTHGNYLDTGTATATSSNDSAMATVAEVHRPADA